MRVSLVLASFIVACAPALAEDAGSSSNVTVNMDALPVPMPRFKPSADEMRPLAMARPRFKPVYEPPGAEASAPDAASAAPSTAAPDAPAVAQVVQPRAKPETQIAAVAPAAP